MQVLLTNIKNYSVDIYGALAHLARALPWHGRGDRFESDMLHHFNLYTYYEHDRKTRSSIFDLYGTLLDIENDESSARLWDGVAGFVGNFGDSRTPEQLRLAYDVAIQQAIRDSRKDIYERAIALMLSDNVQGSDKEEFYKLFRRNSRNALALRNFVPELLAELRNHKIKTALVSNAERALTEIDFADTNFPTELFDFVVLSSDIGVEKPQPDIYEHALEQLGVTADRTIYVGDSLPNDVMGPAALGMRSIWIANGVPSDTKLPDLCIGTSGTDGAGILSLID